MTRARRLLDRIVTAAVAFAGCAVLYGLFLVTP